MQVTLNTLLFVLQLTRWPVDVAAALWFRMVLQVPVRVLSDCRQCLLPPTVQRPGCDNTRQRPELSRLCGTVHSRCLPAGDI
jgi:hypothetical protein